MPLKNFLYYFSGVCLFAITTIVYCIGTGVVFPSVWTIIFTLFVKFLYRKNPAADAAAVANLRAVKGEDLLI